MRSQIHRIAAGRADDRIDFTQGGDYLPPAVGSPGRRFVLQLTFYTRSGCHLCEEAWEATEAVRKELQGALALTVEMKDITMDSALLARFRYDIPVLEIDGRPAFRHRVDAERLRQRLVEGRPAPLEEEAA